MNIDTDSDTLRLLEIVVVFLQKYFSYTEVEATCNLEAYYASWKDVHDDDFYHDLGAYHVAVRVHYFVGLSGNQDGFHQWRLENNLRAAPSEANEYFRKHYFHE